VREESSKGALVSPGPTGNVEMGGEREVGIRKQTKKAKDGRLNQDPKAQPLQVTDNL